jgi:hypothetical protein
VAEAHGIGLTRARLWDARGAFGVSLQACLAERREGRPGGSHPGRPMPP